jgi:hypothetical protein
MPKEIFSINGLEEIEPFIRKLAVKTSRLSNPVLYMVIGKDAHRVEHVLKLAADCICPLTLNLVVHERMRDKVVDALKQNGNVRLNDEVVVTDREIPSFMVSEAGYYIQDGLSFDEATLSFTNERIKSFLLDLYQEITTELIAA